MRSQQDISDMPQHVAAVAIGSGSQAIVKNTA
jgi:hypothetical protein